MTRTDISDISMATGEWNKTRAYATVKLSSGLTISGVKVIQGSKGLFVGMPSIQRKDKESGDMVWKDCCYIEDEEDRKVFQTVIIDTYTEKVGGSTSAPTNNSGDPEETSFF